MDAMLRERIRRGEATARDLARAGLAHVVVWDGCGNGLGNGYGNGRGNGDGRGHGNGNGNGHGSGDGHGDGYGYGNGYGNGRGRGNGDGHGDGNGHGDGYGNGYGNGNGEEALVRHTDYMAVGSPVVVRSYVSGVFVGRLAGGESGSVALTDWRWLRRWSNVGGEGSVYDLVASRKVPDGRGPLMAEVTVIQQADVMAISESAYKRLAAD